MCVFSAVPHSLAKLFGSQDEVDTPVNNLIVQYMLKNLYHYVSFPTLSFTFLLFSLIVGDNCPTRWAVGRGACVGVCVCVCVCVWARVCVWVGGCA